MSDSKVRCEARKANSAGGRAAGAGDFAYCPQTTAQVPAPAPLPPAAKVAVAPVDVSVIVRLPAAVPTVRLTLPDESPVMVAVPMPEPAPPETVNSPATASCVHTVFPPVRMSV